MAAPEAFEGPFGVDFCPTRTDQWRPTPPVQRRTGSGHQQPFTFAVAKSLGRLLYSQNQPFNS
jgi:hypothetical protein